MSFKTHIFLFFSTLHGHSEKSLLYIFDEHADSHADKYYFI